MNRRTFIQASAAVAVLAAAASPAAVLGQTLGLPRLHFFYDSLPAHAKLALLPAQREQILQYSRVQTLQSGALLMVDRGSGVCVIAAPVGTQARLAGVWDAAELGDGTLLVATHKHGLLRTNLDFKTLEVLRPHDDMQRVTRVAVAGEMAGETWVAYMPTARRVVSSSGSDWPAFDRLGLRSLKDIIGLADGRFVVADAVAASVVLTDGHTREILASYRDRHGDPVAPMALLKARNHEIWVRTTASASLQVRGFA